MAAKASLVTVIAGVANCVFLLTGMADHASGFVIDFPAVWAMAGQAF